jgi:ubiquinone/menaquinone biosynthesis C-methylase UbiE
MGKIEDSNKDPFLSVEGVNKIYRRRARRYRILHHLTTRFRDTEWRQEVAWLAGIKSGDKVLDICSGIGLSPIEYLKVWKVQGIREVHITGIDFNQEMLRVGKELTKRLGLEDQITLVRGDAMDLRRGEKEEGFAVFEESTFDAVICICGIGGIEKPRSTYREMLRVLKEGGRAVLLDMREPINGLHKDYPKQKVIWDRITVPWVLRRFWGWNDPSDMIDEVESTSWLDKRGNKWVFETLIKAIRTENWWFSIPAITTARFTGKKIRVGN